MVPQKFTSLNKTLKQMILKLDSFGRLWEAKLMWQVMHFIVVSCLTVGHVLSALFYPVVGGRWGGGKAKVNCLNKENERENTMVG